MKVKQYGFVIILSAFTGWMGGMMSGVFLEGGPVYAQMPDDPAKVATAEGFHVVDANGNLRAAFGLGVVTGQQPGFALYDKKGRDRVKISLMSDGAPVFSLHDGDGEARTLMVVGMDDQPFLDLFGKGNRAHVVMGVASEGRPDLSFYDKTGNLRSDLTLSAAGNPGFIFLDDKKNVRSSYGLWPDGDPFLAISDGDGRASIEIGHTHLVP
jgi:hypothetical protein